MNDATRARIVRGWLVLAAVTVGWLLCPSWWWLLPVALMMPPLGGVTCSICSTPDHEQYQIDISGFTNLTCTLCSNLDGSFVLDRTADPCIWIYDLTPTVDCGFTIYVRLKFGFESPGDAVLNIEFYSDSGRTSLFVSHRYTVSVQVFGVVTCNNWVNKAMSFNSYQPNGTFTCQGTSPTITFTGL